MKNIGKSETSGGERIVVKTFEEQRWRLPIVSGSGQRSEGQARILRLRGSAAADKEMTLAEALTLVVQKMTA
jgi:hypothetical protein